MIEPSVPPSHAPNDGEEPLDLTSIWGGNAYDGIPLPSVLASPGT